MNTDFLSVEENGGIVTLTMNRPPANALDLEATVAATEVVRQFHTDIPKALILTGLGDFFSGGLDLKVIPQYSQTQQKETVLALSDLVEKLYSFPAPTVAAINGHAVAAGTLLALCTDHRIAADTDIKFGLTGTKVGIPYPSSAQAVIQAELAPPVVRRMLLGAEVFGLSEAVRVGIVDEIQPADGLLQAAEAEAKRLAEFPSATYRAVKRELRSETLSKIKKAIEGNDPFLESWLAQS